MTAVWRLISKTHKDVVSIHCSMTSFMIFIRLRLCVRICLILTFPLCWLVTQSIKSELSVCEDTVSLPQLNVRAVTASAAEDWMRNFLQQ